MSSTTSRRNARNEASSGHRSRAGGARDGPNNASFHKTQTQTLTGAQRGANKDGAILMNQDLYDHTQSRQLTKPKRNKTPNTNKSVTSKRSKDASQSRNEIKSSNASRVQHQESLGNQRPKGVEVNPISHAGFYDGIQLNDGKVDRGNNLQSEYLDESPTLPRFPNHRNNRGFDTLRETAYLVTTENLQDQGATLHLKPTDEVMRAVETQSRGNSTENEESATGPDYSGYDGSTPADHQIPDFSVATTIMNANKQVVRTIQTSDPNSQQLIEQSLQSIVSDSGSRDISTVNTNRLQQIFDTYRNGYNPHKLNAKMAETNISINDMERARTQFPAYMNRVYGRKQSEQQSGGLPARPYEIPNLNLFPPKKSPIKSREEITEDVKKQFQSGVIQKVSVQSSNTLPSVSQVHRREKNQAQGTIAFNLDRPGFRLKKHSVDPQRAAIKPLFDTSKVEDDQTFQLSQSDKEFDSDFDGKEGQSLHELQTNFDQSAAQSKQEGRTSFSIKSKSISIHDKNRAALPKFANLSNTFGSFQSPGGSNVTPIVKNRHKTGHQLISGGGSASNDFKHQTLRNWGGVPPIIIKQQQNEASEAVSSNTSRLNMQPKLAAQKPQSKTKRHEVGKLAGLGAPSGAKRNDRQSRFQTRRHTMPQKMQSQTQYGGFKDVTSANNRVSQRQQKLMSPNSSLFSQLNSRFEEGAFGNESSNQALQDDSRIYYSTIQNEFKRIMRQTFTKPFSNFQSKAGRSGRNFSSNATWSALDYSQAYRSLKQRHDLLDKTGSFQADKSGLIAQPSKDFMKQDSVFSFNMDPVYGSQATGQQPSPPRDSLNPSKQELSSALTAHHQHPKIIPSLNQVSGSKIMMQDQSISIEQEALLAQARLESLQNQQMEQYAKTFTNGFQRRHRKRLPAKRLTQLTIDAPALKADTHMKQHSGEKTLEDNTKENSDEGASGSRKVGSQQRSAETFRLQEYSASSPQGHQPQIEIQPGTHLPIQKGEQMSEKIINIKAYMKIEQSQTQTELMGNHSSAEAMQIGSNGQSEGLDMSRKDNMHYVDSQQKLQPKNLDQKSAASSSEHHLHQLLMPLSQLVTDEGTKQQLEDIKKTAFSIPASMVNSATQGQRSKTQTRQSHLDMYTSQGGATNTSIEETSATNLLLNMLAMQQDQTAGQSARQRFNPNSTLFFMANESIDNLNRGSGLTVSHFGSKTSPRGVPLKQNSPRRKHPTHPNEKGSGLILGSKIEIKQEPKNYNIMADLDLKDHFLKKLLELRDMREEYYRAPEVKPDPVELLKAKAEEAALRKAQIESPWEDEELGKNMNSDDDDALESPSGEREGLTNSVLLQYYSKKELNGQKSTRSGQISPQGVGSSGSKMIKESRGLIQLGKSSRESRIGESTFKAANSNQDLPQSMLAHEIHSSIDTMNRQDGQD